MTWPDLLERPRPEADATLRYGGKVNQLVDLWLPIAPSLRPVVLMVHGGCWQSDVADRRIMNWIAADLRRRGIAVWNIEYRGVDRPGGGYPGTFHDMAAAADALRGHAAPLWTRHKARRRGRPSARAGISLCGWPDGIACRPPARCAAAMRCRFTSSSASAAFPISRKRRGRRGSGCGIEVVDPAHRRPLRRHLGAAPRPARHPASC